MSKNLIIKNTFYIYMQIIVTTIAGLLSIRYILDNLGAVDFGIYSVLVGIIGLMMILSNAMSASVQRYLSFELGKDDTEQVKAYFNSSMFIYITLGFIVMLIAMLFKDYMVENLLTIPQEKTAVAHTIYLLVVINLVFNILLSPFQALLNARENMIISAIIAATQSLFILFLSLILYMVESDKLMFYASGLVAINLLFSFVLIVVTYKLYDECSFSREYFFNKNYIHSQLGFSGWNLFGGLSSLVPNQGTNVLLNMFFGPVVNGAFAVSFQISSRLKIFSDTIMKASRPQIIKAESVGDRVKLHALSFSSSKFAFFVLYIFALPVFIELPFILDIWLVEVPKYALEFCRLIVIIALINQITVSLISVMLAVGKIALYQTIVGSILISLLPIGYLLLKNGYSPQSILYAEAIIAVTAGVVRVFFVKHYADMQIRSWVSSVFIKILYVVVPSSIILFLIENMLTEGWIRFLIVLIASVGLNAILMFTIGMKNRERETVQEIVLKIKKRVRI